MNILVTGANGQLGSAIKDNVHGVVNCNIYFTDVEELDISKSKEIIDYLLEKDIDVVINCAAYTAVDRAEEDSDRAQLVNATAVNSIVKACEIAKARLIHVSTDYVFNGEQYKPLTEDMVVRPLGVYGITKREGEEYVLNSQIESIIIRTSWLYSSYGNNFVKTMMRLGKEKEELGVIFDQVGTPTYADDLAVFILQIINNQKKLDEFGKVYHFSNEGVASWYDFAIAIMEISKIDCKVKPLRTEDYPTPAKRPHYSIMDKSKTKKTFNVEIPYWRDSLKKCIDLILTN